MCELFDARLRECERVMRAEDRFEIRPEITVVRS